MSSGYIHKLAKSFPNLVKNSSKFVVLFGISALTLTSFGSSLQTKAQADLSNSPAASFTSESTTSLDSKLKSCPENQFLAEYFDDVNLGGESVGSKCDSEINLAKTSQETSVVIGNTTLANNWSVRWSGKIKFEPGKYEFKMLSDDGSRLFIDNQKVIDSWKDQDGSTPNLYQTELDGTKEIKMEYYQVYGLHTAQLTWEKTEQSKNSDSKNSDTSSKDKSKKTGYLRYTEGINPITKDKKESKHAEEKWSFIDIETKKEVYVKISETLIKTKGGAYYLTKDKVEISYSQEEWDKALKDPKFLLNIVDIKPLGLPAVDPFLGNNTASDFFFGQYADKLGTQKYATIMCKFPDIANLPTTQARLNGIINGTATNTLQDYFKKSSFGKLDFSSDIYSNNNLWYTLPQPESFYVGPNFTALRDDCANAANADINFLNYDGIINIYNGEVWNDNSAWGGPSNWMFLDGQWKQYGMTYIPPWVYAGFPGFYNMDFGAFAHEIGHAFGLPHSSSQNFDGSINEYGSRWDLMSDSRVLVNNNFVSSDLIAYYKDRLGWIADNKRSRVLTSNSANPRVIEIESNSNPTDSSTNFQVAYVKDNSNLPGISQFETYSLESRFFRDYDQNLASNGLQESVVIHKISSFGGSDRRAMLTTSLTAQTGNNNFSTSSGDLNIRVCEKKTSSFVVAVNSRCPGSIGDQVWEDLNGNNVKDTNENGVNGVTVNLLNQNGQAVTNINNQPIPAQTTQTIANIQGSYRFNNLRPGQYRVNFSGIPNNMSWVVKTGNLIDPNNSDANLADFNTGRTDIITITEGQNIDYVDAGVRKKSGILGNKVWEDLNGNNLQDAGEPGINGVTASLLNQAGQPVRDVDGVIIPNQTTATVNGEAGIYNFIKVPDTNTVNVNGQAQQYIVRFSNIPANMKPVTKTGNAADPNNSDINTNLQTDPLTLLFWETTQGTINSIDAGFRRDIPNRILAIGNNQGTGVLGLPSLPYGDQNLGKSGYTTDMNNVQKVLSDGFSTIFLKQDGTVWTVGSNTCGNLGNSKPGLSNQCTSPYPDRDANYTPTQITTLGNDNKDIELFSTLKNNGEVWGWGVKTACINNQSPVENGCVAGNNISTPKKYVRSNLQTNNVIRLEKNGVGVDTNGNWWKLGGGAINQTLVPNITMPQIQNISQESPDSPVYTLLKSGTLYENNTQILTGIKSVSTSTINLQGKITTRVRALTVDGRIWAKGFDLITPGEHWTRDFSSFKLTKDENGQVLTNVKSIGVWNNEAVTNSGEYYGELSLGKLSKADLLLGNLNQPVVDLANSSAFGTFLIVKNQTV